MATSFSFGFEDDVALDSTDGEGEARQVEPPRGEGEEQQSLPQIHSLESLVSHCVQ